MREPKEDGLTGKQRAFVAEYLVDLNGTQAAIRAGYAVSGAAVEAHRLLRNANVAAGIDEAMAQRPGVTRAWIVDELAKIARANAGDFFEWGREGVTVKDSAELTDEQRGVVAEISETKTQHGGTVRVKLSDKQAALEKLGKALGMFKDRHEFSGPDGGPIPVEDRHRVVTDVAKLFLSALHDQHKDADNEPQQ